MQSLHFGFADRFLIHISSCTDQEVLQCETDGISIRQLRLCKITRKKGVPSGVVSMTSTSLSWAMNASREKKPFSLMFNGSSVRR